jgi:uncharacterized protein
VAVFDSPELCLRCNAKCCRYLMLEIDAPTCKGDFENIRWYLCHNDITIFMEKGNHWYLHIQNACRHLTEDGRCIVYDKRPKICRSHDPADCEYDSEYEPKLSFGTLEELDIYIASRFSKEIKDQTAEIRT